MNTKTAYNHQDRALRAIKDVYRRAIMFKMSQDEIISARDPIVASVTKCPQRIKSYLRGAVDILHDNLDQNFDFCYIIDGVPHTTKKAIDRPYIDPGQNLNNYKSGFIWKGSDRAFFIGGITQ